MLVLLVLTALSVGALVFTRTDKDATAGGNVLAVRLSEFGGPGKVSLNTFQGRPLVINTWASWCLFCAAEMPDFQQAYDRVKADVEFLGVNVSDSFEAAQKLVQSTGVRYPLASDPTGETFESLGGVQMPTTLFVDAKGDVLERFSGPLTLDSLTRRLTKHFG